LFGTVHQTNNKQQTKNKQMPFLLIEVLRQKADDSYSIAGAWLHRCDRGDDL
jgi:hypothetical protein